MSFKIILSDLVNIISLRLAVSLLAGGITIYAVIDHQSAKIEDKENDVQKVSKEKVTKNKNSQKNRRPSSVTTMADSVSSKYKPFAKDTSTESKNNFVPPESFNSNEAQDYQKNRRSVRSSPASSSRSSLSSRPTPPLLGRQNIPNGPTSDYKPKKNMDDTLSLNSNSFAVANPNFAAAAAAASKKADPTSSVTNSSSPSSIASSINFCTSNIQSGSFGNPIGVTIACGNPSTIKYCLAVGSCCDPESNGKTYKSQIIIGPKDGSYCLSYIGESDIAGNTVLYKQTYSIDSTFPNLNATHTQTFYQTTELNGSSYMTSTDFGKANFKVGQINLKSHDPGASGLNYSCNDIITNYVSLLSPVSTEVLSLYDVAQTTLNSQVNIPLRIDQLDYGDNFITSYIANLTFVTPLYSCSTTKINLEDFEYFQTDISQGEIGTNANRTFEGQFSTYGFFETSDIVASGNTGFSAEEKSGENLKSGMFGIFY